MNELKYFIFEALSEFRLNQLRDVLRQAEAGEIDNDTAAKIINTAKYNKQLGLSSGKTTGDVFKTKKDGTISKIRDPHASDQPIFHKDGYGFGKIIRNISIPTDAQKNIANILLNNDMMDRYIEYIKSNKGITSNDIIKGNNIYTLLNKTGLNKKTQRELAMYETKMNGTSQGKFEVILKMTLKDYKNIPSIGNNKGDIIAGDPTPIAFELKTEGGRLVSQNMPANFKDMYDVINKVSPNIIKKVPQPYSNQTSVRDLFNAYKEYIPSFDDEIIKNNFISMIVDSISAYYDGESGISNEDFKKFLLSHYNDIETNRDGSVLHRCIACYQLLAYRNEEKWNYIMVIDQASGDYELINGDNLTLEDVYSNNHIYFNRGMKKGSARDKAMGIIYKK